MGNSMSGSFETEIRLRYPSKSQNENCWHSCHWFCKSKVVASARLLARHQTSHDQVLRSVTAETRQAYCALTGHPPG